MRRHAGSLVLVVLAVVLGVFAWLDRGSVTEGERRSRQGYLFPAWRRDDVRSLRLSTGRENIVLQRSGAPDAPWRMKSPYDEPVDVSVVDRLLGTLEFAKVARSVEGQTSGFDSPRLEAWLEMGELRFHFALGGPASQPEGASYLKMDERVVVVDQAIVTALLQPADAYRERAMAPYVSLELAEFSVDGRFSIRRLDETSFRLEGSGHRASRSELDRVWTALASMRAESFLSPADIEPLVAEPEFRIRMVPKDPSRPAGELVVGKPCPGRPESRSVLRKAPTKLGACVPKSIEAGLSLRASELEDRAAVVARDDEIEEVSTERIDGGAKFEVARKGTGFHQRLPEDRDLEPAEAEAVSERVTALAQTRGEIVELGPSATPVATTRVTRGEGSDEKLTLFRTTKDGWAVRREVDGVALQVTPDRVRLFLPLRVAARPLMLFPKLAQAPATYIRVDCRGVVQELERDERGWTMREPRGLPPDTAAAVGAADALLRARALAFVADEGGPSFGFGSPPCSSTVSVRLEGRVESVTVEFGGETASGVFYARNPDGPVFLVDKETKERTTALLVDRHGFKVDPSQAITLTRGATTQRFPPGAAPADLLRALGELQADQALHIGAPTPAEGFSEPFAVVEAKGAEAGAVRFRIGGRTELSGRPAHYARLDGVDVTYIVADNRLEPLLRR